MCNYGGVSWKYGYKSAPTQHNAVCSASSFVHCCTSVGCVLMWSIRRELITGSLGAEGAEPIKRAVKEAFHWPSRKLDSSVTDGDSLVWQTYRRAELGERLGTGSGAGVLVGQWLAPGPGWPLRWQRGRSHTHTHTLPHSCWGANGGWQGGLLLKSCRCLEMAFMWMGALIGVVWRLSLHAEHGVILFCWVLINKQCLKAALHLEGQHSDSLVALDAVCFWVVLKLPLRWPHRLGGADFFPKLFSLIVRKTHFKVYWSSVAFSYYTDSLGQQKYVNTTVTNFLVPK